MTGRLAWLLPVVLMCGPLRADDFGNAMAQAMARMDHDMMVAPTGNPDRDFAAMMIPHHQGAIDMAEVELRFGHDPVLLKLARRIIVDQRREIAVMRQRLPSGSRPAMSMEH